MTLREAITTAARECIEDALRRHRRNISAAARELRVNRTDLYKRMRKYGVEVRARRTSVGAAQELRAWGARAMNTRQQRAQMLHAAAPGYSHGNSSGVGVRVAATLAGSQAAPHVPRT